MDRPSDPRSLDEGDLASHALFLRRLARRLVRDDARADDVAQETWRAALSSPPSEVSSWRGWLAAAARNVARQMARGGARRARHEQAAAPRERLPSTEEVAARLEAERRLIDAVAALPDEDRALILLRHFDGLPPRAIARRMQAPVETVKTRLKRALERLRARLVERGGDATRLHGGLLLVANGLVGKVGVAGGLLGGGVVATWKTAGIATLIVAAAVVAVVQFARLRDGTTPGSRPASEPLASAAEPTAATKSAEAERTTELPWEHDSGAVAKTPPTLDEPPAVDDGSSIFGRFVGPDGAPLEGVEVGRGGYGGEWPPKRDTSDWPSTKSDAEGRFTWRRPPAAANAEANRSWAFPCADSGWSDALTVSFGAWKPGFEMKWISVAGVIGRAMDAGDLRLEAEARIVGRVVVPNGVDVATAVVDLESIEGSPPKAEPSLAPKLDRKLMRARADSSGRFELGGFPGGAVRLWASAPGCLYVPSSVIHLRSGTTVDDVELEVVKLPGDEDPLSIDVQRPDGTPLPGARVSLMLMEHGRRRSSYLATSFYLVCDEHGHVNFPTHGLPLVLALACDPANHLLYDKRDFETGSERSCVLRLRDPIRLEVRVRSSDGSRLTSLRASANEMLESADGFAWSYSSNESSEVTVASPTALEMWVSESPLELVVEAEGCAEARLGPIRAREQVGPIEMTLTAAPALTGRVTSAGVAVPAATVSVLVACSDDEWCVVNGVPSRARPMDLKTHGTDSEGRFRVAMPTESRILLRANAPGLAPGAIGPLEVTPEMSMRGLEIELTRGGTLAGQVAPRPDGTRSQHVVLSNGDGIPRSWPLAADGSFFVDHLAPGRWNVRTSDHEIPLRGYAVTSGPFVAQDPPWNCVVREGETTSITISSDDRIDCILRGEVSGLREMASPWWQAWIGFAGLTDEQIASDARQNATSSRSAAHPYDIRTDGEAASAPIHGDRFEIRRYWASGCDLVLLRPLDEHDTACVATFRKPWTLKQGIVDWTANLSLGRIDGEIPGGVFDKNHVEAEATTADGFRFHARVHVNDDGGFTIPVAPAGEVRLLLEGSGVEQTVTVAAGATTDVTLR